MTTTSMMATKDSVLFFVVYVVAFWREPTKKMWLFGSSHNGMMDERIARFAKQSEPRMMGVYESLRKLIFPFPAGSERDVQWLTTRQVFMNAVTDRPFISKELFRRLKITTKSKAPICTSGWPLEVTVMLGDACGKSGSLTDALQESLKRARAKNSWIDSDARLVIDPLSETSAATLEWMRKGSAGACSGNREKKWVTAIVGVRVPHKATSGHAVIFAANIADRTTIYSIPMGSTTAIPISAWPTPACG
jgi:hypothetical protein